MNSYRKMMQKTLSGLALILFLAACQSTINEQIVLFYEGAPSSTFTPTYFRLYHNQANIFVTWSDDNVDLPNDYSWRQVKLEVESGFSVEKLLFTPYLDDLMLAYTVSDGEYKVSNVSRIDGQTLEPVWNAIVPAFNMGVPAIQEQHIYVTSIGFIGKINVETGEYVWKHDELWQRNDGGYNSFALPIFDGEQVIFEEHPDAGAFYGRPAKRIIVDLISGEILYIDAETPVP
jgi:hypothetical protein